MNNDNILTSDIIKGSKVAMSNASWIWLNDKKYPQFQKTYNTIFSNKEGYNFCIAEFEKNFVIEKEVKEAYIYISGDTKFRFWVNDAFIGVGPVAAGGDYGNTKPMLKTFYSIYKSTLKAGCNSIFAQVQLGPDVMTEYSKGHGGFIACCEIFYKDGTTELIRTDESWKVRINTSYKNPSFFNDTRTNKIWEIPQITENIWDLTPSPIPPLSEDFIKPVEIFVFEEYKNRIKTDKNKVCISKGSPVTFIAKFDKIYSGYTTFKYSGDSEINILVECQELIGRTDRQETIITSQLTLYRGFKLQSIGYLQITISNIKDNDICIEDLGLIFTCYPVRDSGSFECSDMDLNKIYEVGKWTLQICRQTLHLDSPIHQETLGCTGDYFILSLINYYTFGDTRLTRLDIVRTADYLRMNKGKMFHTSYSLIWVQMLTDYYKYTGDASVFDECIDALHILMELFNSYVGESRMLDNPPNYMFVDWVPVDGYNLHHPPKAIGQGCLNAFYYKALLESEYISRIIKDDKADIYKSRAEKIKAAFNKNLWDNEKKLYFDGLNTTDQGNDWTPANTDKRYFSQHINSLAVLYNIAENDERMAIMDKVINDNSLIQTQPYFMHYVLEAIYDTGLFDRYGINQIKRWNALIEECDRGMKEVWYGFNCDYSHGWGATPTYQLPSKILGLRILEPGFMKISMDINLYGLEHASIKVPTPYGFIKAELYKDKTHIVSIPEEIKVVKVERMDS